MSCITDSKTLENTFQPSLIYPSLSRYPKRDGREMNDKTDVQACIHYASRLIKLRSELRSSSYISSSSSLQLLKPPSISTVSETSSVSSVSSPSSSSSSSSFATAMETTTQEEVLNKTGRENPSTNTNQQQYDDDINFMDNSEDESEIMDRMLLMTGKKSTSQLTYLTDIIRQSMQQRQNFYSQNDQFYLALPPKDSLHSQNKKLNPTNPSVIASSKNQNTLKKSSSIRDILFASSQEDMKPQQQKQQLILEKKYRHPNDYPSFPLASQLASASTAYPQGEDERKKKKKQKENVFSVQELPLRKREESASSIMSSSTTSSFGDDDDSDTESEVILRHAVPATAFLVSLSPSAAAAASAARYRRRRPILHGKDNNTTKLSY